MQVLLFQPEASDKVNTLPPRISWYMASYRTSTAEQPERRHAWGEKSNLFEGQILPAGRSPESWLPCRLSVCKIGRAPEQEAIQFVMDAQYFETSSIMVCMSTACTAGGVSKLYVLAVFPCKPLRPMKAKHVRKSRETAQAMACSGTTPDAVLSINTL